jgi:hypothetical protein
MAFTAVSHDPPEDPTDPDLRRRVVRIELAPAVFALFRQVQSAMADEHGGCLDDNDADGAPVPSRTRR